ncbi:ABC transporter ATP-binding protein [Gottschalkiaceae bacterium SANA]|nr:ABC transporter ATP-binding protein [Gottschalkiaceae bacterium SANA]
MTKILKYLKPFTLWILVAIALLYGQAMADLALPDYMSNIVNVGIQQGGNENALPEVLRQADLEKMELFVTADNKALIEASYQFIEPGTSEYKKVAETYPNITNEGVYRLKSLTEEETADLELEVSKALLAVTGVQQAIANADDSDFEINGQTIPAGTDIFAMLERMPAEQRLQMMEASNEQFAALGDAMILQAGANATITLYQEMGLDVDQVRQNYILMTGLIMLGITLLGAIASISVGFIASKVAAGLGRDLRKRIFDKVSRFSNAEFDQFSTASLITRSTNDIMQVQNLMVVMIRMVFYAPILGIGGVIKAMNSNSSMSWIIALAVGILILMIAVIFSIAMPKFKIVQKQVDRVNLVMREALTGMMVIRAFNTQAFEEDRFDQANRDLTATNLFVNRVMVFLMPVMMFVMNAVMILIVWVGAKEIANANMQVGDMMAFMQYAMQIIMAFLMMSMMFIMIPRASVAAGRIAEVLNVEAKIVDPADPKVFTAPVSGRLEFKDVSFKYPGAEENMLKKLNFTANPGETTAIIGSTGSGKTTLVNLIPRLYDVTEGQILVDGIDIRQVTQHDLRSHIGYIPQKASLFSGDIESNLLFAKEDATIAEMEEAIRIAQAREFVEENKEGMARQISQGGSNVSGGQKQRLSIARALVKRPEIYIFDDSFSALDFQTDRALRQALKDKTGESTLLIVAQRISTIKNANQIIVLDDGRMVGMGTHDELMKSCETYKEIAYSQLSKEELA